MKIENRDKYERKYTITLCSQVEEANVGILG
jgi:hypothetical protein